MRVQPSESVPSEGLCGGVSTARVQERISREYTRGSAERSHRAGTGKDFPRIYPWKRGKELTRGYRREFRADIPVGVRKRATARVQEKISRGYTRGSAEKSHRAGTGERKPADIPVNMRSLLPRELY